MIKVENLSKSFDGYKALNNMSMHVEKGSVYALVGPNGAGKSTVIRHIMGIYRPDSGTILVDGEPLYENREIKSEIAYIPDDFFYFAQANILDMKKFYKGLYKTFDEELFNKLREFFPTIDLKRPIRKLSKGMQKQVAFWLSLCIRPKLMVLDEPVDGLDPVMRRQIWSLIMQETAERETTVLVSSHNLRELEDVCDHVGIINKGEIIIEKSLDDLQGSVSKLQVVFENAESEIPSDINVLHSSSTGRVKTIIAKGESDYLKDRLMASGAAFVDALPLSLEEIFIYEMEGANYEVKEMLF